MEHTDGSRYNWEEGEGSTSEPLTSGARVLTLVINMGSSNQCPSDEIPHVTWCSREEGSVSEPHINRKHWSIDSVSSRNSTYISSANWFVLHSYLQYARK